MNIVKGQGGILLSKAFLLDSGIKPDNVKKIFQRNRAKVVDDGYIPYNDIPTPTRAKLPSENDLIGIANAAKYDSKKNGFLAGIREAYNNGFVRHREYFKNKYPTLPAEKITRAAIKYAVWLFILDQVQNEGVRNNAHLFAAFNEVLTGQYKDEQNFANAKGKAIKNGAESMAIDARWFEAPKNITKVNELRQFWVEAVLSMPKKYKYPQIVEKVNAMCEAAGEPKVSLSWVKKYGKDILKTNNPIYGIRYGKDAVQKRTGYLKAERALFANDRWFMDGKEMPLYAADYQRYQLVLIMDDYSRKIVGYAIGKSENTLVIMSALKMAIEQTGCLPREIVSDKHSFHRTTQAGYFKAETAKIGMDFIADTNPQRKATLERQNQTFDSIFKNMYGYTGEGMKAKSDNAKPTGEYITEAAQNYYTEQAIILAGIYGVDAFNNMQVKGKTRTQLFDESEKPNCFTLNLSEKIKVLTDTAKYIVRRGRIKIKLGGNTYEYELNAALQTQYNNEQVTVRYEDLRNCIYLFDVETDEFIGEVKQAPVIRGAKANQSEKDIETLNKHNGRLTGVDTAIRKRNFEQMRKALEINPEAIYLFNHHAGDKDIRQEFTQKAHLKQQAAEHGINVDNVVFPKAKKPFNIETIMPVAKSKKSPIKAKGDCQPIDFAKEFNND